MFTFTSLENSFIQGYLDVASRQLDNRELAEHKKIVNQTIHSKSLSKEAVLKIMSTLLIGETGDQKFECNHESLERVLKNCEEFTQEHCLGTKEIVVISDKEVIEKISAIICDVLKLKPFKSGNTELSIILASFLLNKVKRPYLILKLSDKDEFNAASTDKLAMRLFIANKYKEYFIGDDKKVYTAIDSYDNASRYKSEEDEANYIVEWHELNREIDKWKKMTST